MVPKSFFSLADGKPFGARRIAACCRIRFLNTLWWKAFENACYRFAHEMKWRDQDAVHRASLSVADHERAKAKEMVEDCVVVWAFYNVRLHLRIVIEEWTFSDREPTYFVRDHKQKLYSHHRDYSISLSDAKRIVRDYCKEEAEEWRERYPNVTDPWNAVKPTASGAPRVRVRILLES